MAEIKTIYKGESITLLFTFPAAYDMARLASHKVFVGETEFAGVIEGQSIKMQLKSSDTDRMIGTHKVVLWMNDTTLGLRKPYCGELVVAKTQAAGNTVSVSNIFDIIIPIVISETAITVGDVLYNYVKGDKGNDFKYEDFTPAQIAELQQPAADAIASIQEVELAVETAEGLRVQAEQTMQTNTATAIQNAETATTGANNAAGLANEKAGLADTAATNANTKAVLADTAATNANTVATNVANAEAARVASGSELKTNMSANIEADKASTTKYPQLKAIYDWATGLIASISKIVHATENNSKIEATSTGASIKRNVADANSAVVVELVNPSSSANIAEYKFATALVASIDKTGLFAGGTEQTTANKNKFYPLCKDISGNVIAKRFTQIWNGSAYVADSSVGFGYLALIYNTGTYSNGFGNSSLQNNTGANSNGFGNNSLQNNTGAYSNGIGNNSLQNNTGAFCVGIGWIPMRNNTGSSCNAIGDQCMNNNTGSNCNSIGTANLRYNQKDNNTAIGNSSYSGFLANIAGNKTANSSAVDITLERITLTAHGFGAVNAIVNIKYASTDGTAIGGLTVGDIYQVKITDANTVEFITGSQKINLTSQGTGNHTFTPQFAYTNTTCLGANTQPNRDNQVVLGSTAVDTVKMGGTARTIASATADGVKGETCWDANYFYICVATNTWKRIALSTW